MIRNQKIFILLGGIAFFGMLLLNVNFVEQAYSNLEQSNTLLEEVTAIAQSGGTELSASEFTCYTSNHTYCKMGVNCYDFEWGTGCTPVTCAGCP